jgi:hypothetical protein
MKTGVLDIGTRASRLLLADIDNFKRHGFDFRHFRNIGEKTFAGDGIIERKGVEYFGDSHSPVDPMKKLNSTIAFISNAKEICRTEGIALSDITAVGTEVFRRVANWRDVLDHIEKKTSIRIRILDPLEEAECTFYATKNGCNQYLMPKERFAVLEQGGGSLQLTTGYKETDGEWVKQHQTSIPELGTLLLRRDLYQKKAAGTNRQLKATLNEFQEESFSIIKQKLDSFKMPPHQGRVKIFALGSVITSQCRPKSAREYHGKEFSLEDLKNKAENSPVLLRYGHHGIIKLLNDAVKQPPIISESLEDIHNALEEIFGLACYTSAMRYFGVNSLQVSGVALRYGVFFRIADNNWENIREWNPD